MPLGTVLAFMMAVTALSLPEMIILKKVVKVPLLALFAAYLAIAFVIVGMLFNQLRGLYEYGFASFHRRRIRDEAAQKTDEKPNDAHVACMKSAEPFAGLGRSRGAPDVRPRFQKIVLLSQECA